MRSFIIAWLAAGALLAFYAFIEREWAFVALIVAYGAYVANREWGQK